ncbi:MAG: hypothetical protein V4754_22470 [Pseudomonadota bacterium]
MPLLAAVAAPMPLLAPVIGTTLQLAAGVEGDGGDVTEVMSAPVWLNRDDSPCRVNGAANKDRIVSQHCPILHHSSVRHRGNGGGPGGMASHLTASRQAATMAP